MNAIISCCLDMPWPESLMIRSSHSPFRSGKAWMESWPPPGMASTALAMTLLRTCDSSNLWLVTSGAGLSIRET
ncbi:hypothetical protein D9M69_680330 [compost metagenome]